MSSAVSSPPTCARCGSILAPADLACSACGLLVHVNELQELSHQAQWLEARDRLAAAAVWRRCLELLPSESPQAGMVAARIASLEQTRMSPVARTGLSMLMSIAVYGFIFRMDYGNALGFVFAAGFILLILVHEMGHVMALRSYGIPGSPPTFIPFVGAVISVPPMRNALEEAVVGISGPVLGTIGALTCFAVYRITHINMLLDLSFYGILINLLNLLPIPPLDGGRVTAAISPWLWPLGFLMLIGMLVGQYVLAGDSITGVSPVMVLILVFAAPRLWRTFRHRERAGDYYKIARSASWAIGTAYFLLAAILIGMFLYTRSLGAD